MSSLNTRKTGKYTEDPIKNLPNMPEKRVKQSWIDPNVKIDVQINAKENLDGKSSLDLIKQINSSKVLSIICVCGAVLLII
jgi:hypothetical protein